MGQACAFEGAEGVSMNDGVYLQASLHLAIAWAHAWLRGCVRQCVGSREAVHVQVKAGHESVQVKAGHESV